MRQLAVLTPLFLLAAAPLAAQSGRFRVDGRGYAMTAVLQPEGAPGGGGITWSCDSGSTVDVRIAVDTAGWRVTYVVWRFDEDPADTTFLVRGALRRHQRPSFTARAIAARRLSVRVMGPDPTVQGTEYVYDLSRASVLGRLPCADPARNAPPVGWPPPEGLVANPPIEVMRSNGEPGNRLALELREVAEPPQVINGAELLRDLSRNYPGPLRDGVQGTVNVRFLVLEDGRIAPGSVTILQSSGPAYERPVMTHLPTLHFRPARVGGRPVKVWVEQPIVFAAPQ